MTDPRLSSATKNLVRLARADGPSAAARAKMWAGVSGAVGGAAAGGAAAASGAATGGLSAAKMLTIGTLLGGPLTVGLAVTLLHIGALRRVPDPASRTPMVAASFVPQRMSAPSDVFSSTSVATPMSSSTRTALSTRISTQAVQACIRRERRCQERRRGKGRAVASSRRRAGSRGRVRGRGAQCARTGRPERGASRHRVRARRCVPAARARGAGRRSPSATRSRSNERSGRKRRDAEAPLPRVRPGTLRGPALFADPVAMPPSGIVTVQEVRLLIPPAASLGLDENRHPSCLGQDSNWLQGRPRARARAPSIMACCSSGSAQRRCWCVASWWRGSRYVKSCPGLTLGAA